VGTGRTAKAAVAARAPGPARPSAVGSREVRVDRGPSGVVGVDVYDGAALGPGHRIVGPALVDGSDTTVWVPPGATLLVDRYCTMEVSR